MGFENGPAGAECPARFAGSYVRVLEALCDPARFRASAVGMLEELARAAGCEAAAVRVRDPRGDYPFLISRGFDDDFVRRESSLCRRGAQGWPEWDERGRMVLECLCGAVLRGETSGSPGHFTPGGSFFTNAASALASDPESANGLRGTCVARGYESIALVPLRDGDEIVGLLQFADRRKDRFEGELIAFLEAIGRRMGAAVQAARSLEELAAARREMEEWRLGREQSVVIEEMASALAHDIKNPLASMSLAAGRLRKALRGDAKLDATVECLCSAMQKLSDTVTRVTGGFARPRPDRAPVDLNGLIEDAARATRPRADAQKVRAVLALTEDLPAILGDRILLKRAILDLLTNALDAMPSGGTLRLESRFGNGRCVEVAVIDSGPGIDPLLTDGLFKPFGPTGPDGTGMGLSIVRRIAEIHSGGVRVHGASGGGTEAVLSVAAQPRGAGGEHPA